MGRMHRSTREEDERKLRETWEVSTLPTTAYRRNEATLKKKFDEYSALRKSSSQSKLFALQGRGGFNSSLAKGKPTHKYGSRPKSAGAFKSRPLQKTQFRKYYSRGDLPMSVDFDGAVRKVHWKVDLETIDLSHYLPIFFEGLQEQTEPYRFLAEYGLIDLLEIGGSRCLPAVPHLIMPIKVNLATRNMQVICVTLRQLQRLVRASPDIGRALVPYYRQILLVFNLFITKRVNCGDKMDYGQHRNDNLGDIILETLQLLERTGGEDAFVNIKYMVPTYESCV